MYFNFRFIKVLEKKSKLLRNYTQNIDTLEQVVGIENVIECHGKNFINVLSKSNNLSLGNLFFFLGSFATASCTQCGHKVSAENIRPDVFEQRIPRCPICVDSTGT